MLCKKVSRLYSCKAEHLAYVKLTVFIVCHCCKSCEKISLNMHFLLLSTTS